MKKPVFPKRELAKKAGWFSRRYKTNAVHLAAKECRAERMRLKLVRARMAGE